jgi:hypothetical protein
MKKCLAGILIVCALAGLVWYFFIARPGESQIAVSPAQSENPGPAPEMPASGRRASVPAPTSPSPGAEATATPGAGSAADNSTAPQARPFLLGSADFPLSMDAATVLSNMRVTVNQYRSMFGENPVGTNPEITKALTGDNPKQARFIKEELGLRINGGGELVDYWGTPFFFHQLSGTEMEIHSAGPDKVMWTADDLVTK